MRKYLLYIGIFILMVFPTAAATIHGEIYDLSLHKVNNAVVEINSTPLQRMVAVNGTYEFEVQRGSYRIRAFYEKDNKMTARENITIVDNGNYILDLFLYPEFSEDNDLYNSLDFQIDNPVDSIVSKKDNYFFLFIPIVLLAFAVILFIYRRKPEKKPVISEDDDSGKFLKMLAGNHNRMTQKDLRKEFPMSEAKVSLIIADLESRGKIRKIKKGRTNIIILSK